MESQLKSQTHMAKVCGTALSEACGNNLIPEAEKIIID